jgi:hypothetical protein
VVFAPPELFAEPCPLAWPALFGTGLGEGWAFPGSCERAADDPDGLTVPMSRPADRGALGPTRPGDGACRTGHQRS